MGTSHRSVLTFRMLILLQVFGANYMLDIVLIVYILFPAKIKTCFSISALLLK